LPFSGIVPFSPFVRGDRDCLSSPKRNLPPFFFFYFF
jgi:hypothetical protein